jgi:predicted tellurium resistance membrane protein TerC
VIIAWVAVKLFVEYAHQMHWIGFTIPKTLSLGLIVVIFGISYLIARKQGPKEIDEAATKVIEDGH